MTVLQRTDLTTSQKIECAAAAVARQHEHGAKTALSETYEISRPTVYAVGATAESVLRTHFEAPLLGGAGVTVRVDDAQLRRAVVALRVLAPNAIRPIEDLLPLLYPGVKVCYGTIQAMLVEAVRELMPTEYRQFLGLCPDPTNHLRRFPDSTPLRDLEALRLDMLKIVHFKQMRDGNAIPTVDDGDLDCRELRDILTAKGYTGAAIMEIPPHADVFDNLEASYEYLSQ